MREWYVATGQAPARVEACSVKVLTMVQPDEYEELGFFEKIEGTSSTADFLDYARAQICAAGGDAIATQLNGYGYIVRALVLKRKK